MCNFYKKTRDIHEEQMNAVCNLITIGIRLLITRAIIILNERCHILLYDFIL